MNRTVGGVLLTGMVVSVLSLSSSYSRTENPGAPATPHAPRFAENSPPPQAVGSKKKLCQPCVPEAPESATKEAIEEFYGDVEAKQLTALVQELKLPQNHHVDTLIVTVPDPIETHLSLFFDRTMDALEQALTRQGYFFAGSTLPWDPKEHLESTDWRIRQGQTQFESLREELPGLLIYRKPSNESQQEEIPLFVLVVGETPTTGIHKDQLRRALELAKSWSSDARHVRILGPTFSGSLPSLVEFLREDHDIKKKDHQFYFHSGTVTSAKTAENFKASIKQLDLEENVKFASFQENDDYGLQRFIAYVRTLGYPEKKIPPKPCFCEQTSQPRCDSASSCPVESERIHEVVLLTEDETAYGGGVAAMHDPPSETSLIATLSFPRDISQLRSAYQQDFIKAESSANKKTLPHSSLPLDFEDTGGDKDTIPSFAHRQTPISQEAILFGIITNLKRLHPKFVVIRATNPLDELFLARFLRKAYPKIRVVTIGADALFQQQQDDPILEGTLAISPYSLRPDADHYIPPIDGSQSKHTAVLTFASNFSAGVYNAALSLLACSQTKETCPEAPATAPYHEYGWSREWPEEKDPDNPDDRKQQSIRPALWLLALGHDGYWPVARLNANRFGGCRQRAVRTIPSVTVSPLGLRDIKPSSSLSTEWIFFSLSFISIAIAFTALCLLGKINSPSGMLVAFNESRDSQRSVYLVTMASGLLLGLLGLLLPYTWTPNSLPHIYWTLFLVGLFCLMIAFSISLVRRKAFRSVIVYFVFCTLSATCFAILAKLASSLNYLTVHRLHHVLSGVSPALPTYLLLGALFWWCWKGLQGQALIDSNRPKLPDSLDLGGKGICIGELIHSEDLTESNNQKLVNVLTSPFSGLSTLPAEHELFRLKNWKKLFIHGEIIDAIQELVRQAQLPLWVTLRIAVPSVALLLIAYLLLDFYPVYSLEGIVFDRGYALAVGLVLFLLLTDLGRFLAGWLECRRILNALELLPLRRGFSEIKGFSWRPIWRLAAIQDRILARECESWGQIASAHKPKMPVATSDSGKRELHKFFASECANTLKFLFDEWGKEDPFKPLDRSDEKGCYKNGKEKEEDIKPIPIVAGAERFTCYVYLNFVLTVLLRLRILGFSVLGIYVFLMLSLTCYPFEPHNGIRAVLFLLLVLILTIVTIVYVQLYRDPILSRITDTNPGELGTDFWMRIGAYAALPVLSLLATQYPEVGRMFFSWLQPVLDALTK